MIHAQVVSINQISLKLCCAVIYGLRLRCSPDSPYLPVTGRGAFDLLYPSVHQGIGLPQKKTSIEPDFHTPGWSMKHDHKIHNPSCGGRFLTWRQVNICQHRIANELQNMEQTANILCKKSGLISNFRPKISDAQLERNIWAWSSLIFWKWHLTIGS